MSSTVKRDREWEASASDGASAAPDADADVKRPRISSPPSYLPSDASCAHQRPVLTSGQLDEAHPMAVLDAIRAKLQSTSDPHLQARLLLQYSAAAASPGAKTAAAIDFLFSFLQQNQTQSETQTDGNQKDAGSSGAIVLLAVKAAVVEPMIQVDAMGEQLMQCMSVGEDFKLRRDMMRIVVDCLMLTNKYKQVETLLHTCVQDHDAGMQAICLRAYLRLHNAGRCFAAESSSMEEAQDTAASHFDRLAAFVLFAQSEEVRVLAAQVLVALADMHPQHEIATSKFFPTTTKALFFLPEKAVEHAVLKTQIDEAVVDVAPEVVEMSTRRMMSSGVLLSLLEDVDVDVAVEASRTIARLSEMAMALDAGIGRWSRRALERAITAHFDVLPHTSASSASHLCRVLVNSLGRLLVCRQTLDTKTDFPISSADLSCLIRSVDSNAGTIKPAVVEVLLVVQRCDLSGAWAVQRLVDFLLETVGSTSFENPSRSIDFALLSLQMILTLASVSRMFSFVCVSMQCSVPVQVTSGGSQDQKEAQAFAGLTLPADLQNGCQEMVDVASGVYVKAFALSSSPRTELLQLILLGRVGLVLALLQNTTDSLLIIEKLRWVSKEATRLRFLVSETQHEGDVWLPTQLLSDVSSLDDLKRAIVAIIRKAWPTALIKAAIARCTSATSVSDVLCRRLAIAQASILEPTAMASAKPDPREITANWPFEQRVRISLTNTRDISQVYVKSVLPNGDVAYHHVPARCIRTQGPRKHSAEHTITLTVSPFSDPTAFTVAVCLGHPTLPGSVKVS
uniref:Integrator complex subunit 4/Protein SIEL C-terminal Ig-like domain-containing protein n=1 Tax=Phytophthora ramorum TaxID=164328 RepID=H3HCY0_PHYRM